MTRAPGMRSAGLSMAAGTLLSRVTGLLRTAALAGALGVTSVADAYNIANTVPTVLLVLVTGGSLSAVLIPLLVEREDAAGRRERAESLGALVLWVTVGASVLAAVTSPVLARMFALGLRGDPVYDDFVRLATLFLVLFAPQVAAYGISVHAVAVLNAAGRLALGAFASVATNVVTIAAIAAYVALRPPGDGLPDLREVVVLGGGTTAGVVVMAAIQYWGARRLVPGMRVTRRPRRDETTSRVLQLGRWTMLYVVANQVGLLVVLTVAASVRGGASAYQWAFALMQLPYAVVAVSVLSALYPRVSRAALDDPVRYAGLVAGGSRVLLVLLTPAAVLLSVLATPVTDLLLGYGAVDADGIELIATGVRFFGVALLPFTLFQLLVRASYARSDARTPALVNIAVNGVTLAGAAGAAALASRSPEAALTSLTVAYTASYATGCVLLALLLRRGAPGVLAGLGRLALRLAPAALATAVVAAVVERTWTTGPEPGLLDVLAETTAAAGAALGVYALTAAGPLRTALAATGRRARPGRPLA